MIHNKAVRICIDINIEISKVDHLRGYLGGGKLFEKKISEGTLIRDSRVVDYQHKLRKPWKNKCEEIQFAKILRECNEKLNQAYKGVPENSSEKASF